MNSISLIGRISKDGYKIPFEDGGFLIKTTIAVKRWFSKDKTDFIDLTLFGDNAFYFDTHFGKGDLVCVTGSLEVDNFKAGDLFKTSTSVRVGNIKHLESVEITLARRTPSVDNQVFAVIKPAPVNLPYPAFPPITPPKDTFKPFVATDPLLPYPVVLKKREA